MYIPVITRFEVLKLYAKKFIPNTEARIIRCFLHETLNGGSSLFHLGYVLC